MAYVTGEEIKAWIEVNQSQASFTVHDSLYDDLAVEVTDIVDNYCHRDFTVPSAATQRRYKTSKDGLWIVGLDDIANTTDLAVATDTSDSGSYTTLASTEWFYRTDNKTGVVTEIRFVSPVYPSLQGRDNVRVTARFGWPSVPNPVYRACLILGARLFQRMQSPDGVAGFGDLGIVRISRIDPDVAQLLARYVRYDGLIG